MNSGPEIEEMHEEKSVRSYNLSEADLAGVKGTEKLKGDAIGNTLYSESGLLKTLIALSQFDGDSWSEQLEEQLCFLWDMTFEDDVLAILLEHNFIDLACQAIRASSEPRLLEILIGILGNMTAWKDVRVILSQSATAELLLSLLSSSDALTLVQLVRLFNSCVWQINKSSHSSYNQDENEHCDSDAEVESWITLLKDNAATLNEHLSFILKSSTNEELLQSTLELLNNLCCITSKNHYYSEFLSTQVLLQGLTEGLNQILNAGDESDASGVIWEEKTEKSALHWSQTLSTFTLHDTGTDLIYEQRQVIMRSLCSIFDPLGIPENVLPLDTSKLHILDSMLDVLECLQKKKSYSPPAILPRMLTIFSLISPRNDWKGRELSSLEEFESEEEVEKHTEILRRIYEYCLPIICSTEREDFLEAFGEDPVVKINALLSNLSKCWSSDVQKLADTIKRHVS